MTEDQDHKKQMQALKQAQAEKRKEAVDVKRGLVLVHTGPGKGKSSSAFGVIARALGWGHRIGVVQFIKGSWETGEGLFFGKFPDQITWKTMGEGFTWDTQDKTRDMETATKALATAKEMLTSGDYELVVLDEINVAMNFGYLETDQVLAALDARALKTSVILTGRDAPEPLLIYADTVTEMGEIKHAYNVGILARKGIDF